MSENGEDTSNPCYFGEVCDRLVKDMSLPEWRRRNAAYVQRQLDKLDEFKFSDMPATLESFSTVVNSFDPWPEGQTEARWGRIKAYIKFMLRYSGAQVPGRQPVEKLPEWSKLLPKIETRTTRYYLGAFAHACSLKGIRPEDVDSAVLEEYEADFVNKSKAVYPYRCTRAVRFHWNRAVQTIPQWPGKVIELPKIKGPWALPWSEFSASFRKDLDAWLAWVSKPDLFDPNRPAEPLNYGTISHLRQRVRALASALVLSGYDRRTITDLSILVDPAAAEIALAYLKRRDPPDTEGIVYASACVLRRIARAWVNAAPDTLSAHDALCRRYRGPDGLLSNRTKAQLRQFNDTDNIRKLMEFPRKQLERAQRYSVPTSHRAIAVQIGLAVELLLAAPIALKNLASIHMDRHLTWHDTRIRISFPPSECRTRLGVSFELPQGAVDYLDAYTSSFRPILTTEPNRWLFPGSGDSHKCERWFSSQIKQHIQRQTGLHVGAKLIRHLVVKLYLEAHPYGYEVVRQTLGHWRLSTTMQLYGDANLTEAIRFFDEHMASRR